MQTFCPPFLLTSTVVLPRHCDPDLTYDSPITCQQRRKPLWFNQSSVAKDGNHCDSTNHLLPKISTTCQIITYSLSLLAACTLTHPRFTIIFVKGALQHAIKRCIWITVDTHRQCNVCAIFWITFSKVKSVFPSNTHARCYIHTHTVKQIFSERRK